MQMLRPTDKSSSYGAKAFWFDAINDPGAAQMHYIKQLVLSRPYFERIPDRQLVAGDTGTNIITWPLPAEKIMLLYIHTTVVQ